VLIVILAPLTMRYEVNEAVFPISEGPNQYLSPRQIAWLGTDDIGRDLYSRMIAGLRVSLVIGLAAAIFSTIIGVTVGAVAGLQNPVLATYVNRHIPSSHRATILSVQNLVGNLILAFLQPLGGSIADRFGLQGTFLMFGAVIGVLGFGTLALWSRAEAASTSEIEVFDFPELERANEPVAVS
jgi:ABC-type dipeptide/oligopeptide/nickel transport system permease subunit